MVNALVVEVSDSDDVLAACAARGDHAAFERLVARYEDKIYRFATRMSHNPSDAEEITQDTFLNAYRGLGSFQAVSKFGTWLYRIATNAALMRRRAARRRPTESLDELPPQSFGDVHPTLDWTSPEPADELMERKQLAAQIGQALERLDEAHRSAFVLRDLEELPAEEAAVVLQVSPEAVRQRAHRARLMLRTDLGGLLRRSGPAK